MKKPLILCMLLLLVLALFSGCALTPVSSPAPSGQSGTPSPSETPTPSTQTPDVLTGVVSIETDKYEYKSDYIEVAIEVPQLTGLQDGAVQESVNAVFSSIMKKAQADVTPMEAESKQLIEGGQTVGPYMIDIRYNVPYNRNGILSIVVSDYRYLGGAHGGDYRSAYTFDLQSGEQLSLNDLMETGGAYKDFINSSIRAEIDRRTQTGEVTELVPFKDIGEQPAYYLTLDAIVFYFQQYEYFPYAAGIQEFPIKYADFAGMLKKGYDALKIEPALLEAESDNKLNVGDIGQVILNGDATSGYTWHYTVSDNNIISFSNEQFTSEAAENTVGASGAYVWNFRALKAGTATITFKYYRTWIGESDAAPEDIINYTVTVK